MIGGGTLIYLHVNKYIYIYMHNYTHTHIYIYIHMHNYIYIYIYVFIYIYINTYMHTMYNSNWQHLIPYIQVEHAQISTPSSACSSPWSAAKKRKLGKESGPCRAHKLQGFGERISSSKRLVLGHLNMFLGRHATLSEFPSRESEDPWYPLVHLKTLMKVMKEPYRISRPPETGSSHQAIRLLQLQNGLGWLFLHVLIPNCRSQSVANTLCTLSIGEASANMSFRFLKTN